MDFLARTLVGSTGSVAAMAALGFVIGLGVTYFMEDGIKNEIARRPWLFPVVLAFASAALFAFMAQRLGVRLF